MRGDLVPNVYFDYGDFGNEIRIYIVREVEGLDDIHSWLAPTGDWVEKTDGQSVPSTLRLGRRVMTALVRAVLKYAGEQNMRTEPEMKIQGKLEATERHLEDLRVLLKLRPK